MKTLKAVGSVWWIIGGINGHCIVGVHMKCINLCDLATDFKRSLVGEEEKETVLPLLNLLHCMKRAALGSIIRATNDFVRSSMATGRLIRQLPVLGWF